MQWTLPAKVLQLVVISVPVDLTVALLELAMCSSSSVPFFSTLTSQLHSSKLRPSTLAPIFSPVLVTLAVIEDLPHSVVFRELVTSFDLVPATRLALISVPSPSALAAGQGVASSVQRTVSAAAVPAPAAASRAAPATAAPTKSFRCFMRSPFPGALGAL